MPEFCVSLKNVDLSFSVRNPNNLSLDLLQELIFDALSEIVVDTGAVQFECKNVVFSEDDFEVFSE
jgi:hypothetical protein